MINSTHVTYTSCIGNLAKFIGTRWEYGRRLLLPQSVAVGAAQFVFHRAGQQPRRCIGCLAAACDSGAAGCEEASQPGQSHCWHSLSRSPGAVVIRMLSQAWQGQWISLPPRSCAVQEWGFLGREREIFQIAESVPVFPSLPANRSKRPMSPPALPSHPFSEVNKCQQFLH